MRIIVRSWLAVLLIAFVAMASTVCAMDCVAKDCTPVSSHDSDGSDHSPCHQEKSDPSNHTTPSDCASLSTFSADKVDRSSSPVMVTVAIATPVQGFALPLIQQVKTSGNDFGPPVGSSQAPLVLRI